MDDDEDYEVKKKPDLDEETEEMLRKREKVKSQRPDFTRQEWFRRLKIDRGTWRKPRGIHSQARQNKKYRPSNANVGYRSPKKVRGLHPSGFEEVLVHNKDDLEDLDPDKQAVRVAHGVGMRKRIEIEEKAEELDLRVLNPS
ncbi:MAG: 50S ribosomal protein L32e [Candidatus Thermoplasmatota archaeon]